jgi:hypothetical protein
MRPSLGTLLSPHGFAHFAYIGACSKRACLIWLVRSRRTRQQKCKQELVQVLIFLGSITFGEKAYRVIHAQFCDVHSRLHVACTAVSKGFKAICEFF